MLVPLRFTSIGDLVRPPQHLLFYEHTTNSKSERLQIVVHYQHYRRGNRATASDWRRCLRESVSRLARTTSLVNCSDDDHLLVHRIAALFQVFELEQMTAWPDKADAPNPAMTIWLQSKELWRRVGDLRRSAEEKA